MFARFLIGLFVVVPMLGSDARGELIFAGIGDLAGGGTSSGAYAVSGDGSTVVGLSLSNIDFRAVRWTQAGGLQEIPGLPSSFSTPEGRALGVSGDGSVVAGWYESTVLNNSAIRPFHWNATDGTQSSICSGPVRSGDQLLVSTALQEFAGDRPSRGYLYSVAAPTRKPK